MISIPFSYNIINEYFASCHLSLLGAVQLKSEVVQHLSPAYREKYQRYIDGINSKPGSLQKTCPRCSVVKSIEGEQQHNSKYQHEVSSIPGQIVVYVC